ncbi:sensor histidine kinase RcsC [Comamonadaceae bacterium OS-1]|nr:sensor histidine kinase RcsC [Comamonadaceae bacterium OS-1]
MPLFFSPPPSSALLLHGSHGFWLLALAVGIAIFTACMALHIAGIARALTEPLHRHLALLAGAVAMGGGMWATHFVGMLGFELGTPVQYHLGYSLLSLLPALLASWLALFMLALNRIGSRHIGLAGVLLGCGMAAVVYGGMASMQMLPQRHYDLGWLLLSLALAIALSILALWIRFGLRRALGHGKYAMGNTIVLSGGVLAMAAVSMHYLGTAATRFSVEMGFVPAASDNGAHADALKITVVTVLGTIVVAVVSNLLLRYRTLYQQMVASESQYASLLLNIPGLAYRRRLDTRALVFVSDGALAMTGWSAQECMADGHDFWDQIHPEDSAYLQQGIRQAQTTRQSYAMEYRLVHRDGSLRWVLSRGSVVVDAHDKPLWLDGLLTDITERKTIEQALHASESQYRSLLLHIPGLAFRRELTGARRVLFVSDGVLALTGWTAPEFLALHHNLLDYIHPDDRSQIEASVSAHRTAGTTYESEHRMVHRDGSIRWVLARGRVVHDDGGTPRWYDGLLTDITARKLVEQALNASQQQIQTMTHSIPGVVLRAVADGEWSIHYMSDAMAAISGWPASAFVAGELSLPQLTHPDDLSNVLTHLENALAEHTTYDVEHRLLHRDGHYVWVWARGVASYDAQGKPLWVDGILMDISKRKAVESALEASQAQITSLVRSLPGIALRVMAKDDWPVQFISDAVETFTGYPALAFVHGDLNLATLVHPDDLPVIVPVVAQAIADHTTYSIEYRLRSRDGSYRWVWGRGSATYSDAGQALWIDAFIMDIHERHTMEAELREAHRLAEIAVQSKISFLANMSHEIRTPMNAIIGFTELLLGTDLGQLQRRHMTTVRQSARSLLGLLNDILDTAKLEKGAVELEHKDFSLKALVNEAADAQRLAAENKGLDLEVHYAPAMPEFFRGDAMRVLQVLNNLLGNAVKFTHVGSVQVTVQPDLGLVHIAVTDTGIGIAEDRIDKIFDPFAQADASMSRRFGGTGLGTTIARQLVELMAGQLQVESTLGVGSTFHVRLPLAPGQPVEAVNDVLLYELPGLRILAVDDVPQNLELLSLALGQVGHRVTTASGGAEAVQTFQEHTFDVVLMDVQMPGVDGLEATRRIRQLERDRKLRPTPIVALTASVMEDDRRATEAAGMNGFASKPVQLPELSAEIARVMGIQLPDAEGATTHAIRHDHSSPPAIDWERGADLWGGGATLTKAIRRFLEENHAVLPQMTALLQHKDREAARYLAHRLRGAAGNLCLPTLAHSAHVLEDILPSAQPEQARLALKDVSAAMAAVDLALNDADTEPAPLLPASAPPPAVPAHCHHLLHTLLATTRRNTLDETTLEQLGQALRGTGQSARVAALESALMAFEFDTAQRLLEALLLELAPRAEEPTP